MCSSEVVLIAGLPVLGGGFFRRGMRFALAPRCVAGIEGLAQIGELADVRSLIRRPAAHRSRHVLHFRDPIDFRGSDQAFF